MNVKNTRKVATITLGCKVNQYETDSMQELLKNAGYEVVSQAEQADVYIINTCSVTNIADRKSRQMLHRAKKKNENAVIVAVGCYVQAAKEELKKDPYVDIIVGNNKKKDIVSILETYFMDRKNIEEIIDINDTQEYEELNISSVGSHTRAYIKIQDGCNQFCSYCIIPSTRGRVRSRAKVDVLNEIQMMCQNGYKEFVLTGIHLSSYGVDLEGTSLLDLIQEIAKIPGIARIRLGSLEPRIITEEFVHAVKAIDSFCPHFHLSLQSGCDEILASMNRKYTTKQFEEACQLLRSVYDRPAITTDIIVGFPGETEEYFNTTYEYLKKIKLYEMHIFKYSKRKGTRAEKMEHQISEQDKGIRSKKLAELNIMNKQDYLEELIGESTNVLVEEISMIDGEEYYLGHTMRHEKIAMKLGENQINQIVSATIVRAQNDEVLLGIISDK